MKTTKEFFERLQSDETFAKEISEAYKAKVEAGEQDYKAIIIPIAAEKGYELTEDELDEIYEAKCAELTEEELGKVAGGSTPICGGIMLSFFTLDVLTAISATIYETIKS